MLDPALGDYVWVDEDRDGIQDADEKGLEDVVLTIAGPDGNPVIDVFGNPVGPVTTDEHGKYLFQNLPVLGENESYAVTIDQDASKEALAPYIPTIETDGDRDQDSSTWEAKSEGLTKDGNEDLTLDFGFVLPKVTVGDYVWVDENRDGIQNEGEKGIKDVVLVIVGPDGKPVTDVFGNPVGPVTTDENGKYIFENLPVLKDDESYTVKIDREASKKPLAPCVPTIVTDDNRENDSSVWEATTEGLTKDKDEDLTLDFGFIVPKVSVGDYVWVDANRDGKQDYGEPGIKDVVLTIVGPDGKPVTDIYGEQVGPVATDENGKYTFENLPVLKDGESYTVKIHREASQEPLAPYIPTLENEGDRSEDSSTWEANSEELTENNQRDDTLDFGFVKPKVSVGDYVWFDEDADGIQDDDENGIKGVVLIIVGPDGEPVTDVNGNPVGPITTDENGKYTFENLPVLKDGESYTVKIDKEASKDALKDYVPTPENRGDRDKDSSTWEAKSEGLTKDGDRDPTLDFGFQKPLPWTPIEPPLPSEPTEPLPSEPSGSGDSSGSAEDPQEPNASEDPTAEGKDNLASTGFTALAVLIAGLLLAAAGVLITRRSRGRHS